MIQLALVLGYINLRPRLESARQREGGQGCDREHDAGSEPYSTFCRDLI